MENIPCFRKQYIVFWWPEYRNGCAYYGSSQKII